MVMEFTNAKYFFNKKAQKIQTEAQNSFPARMGNILIVDPPWFAFKSLACAFALQYLRPM